MVPLCAVIGVLYFTSVKHAKEQVGTRLEDSVIQVGKSVDEFMFSCTRGMRDLAEDAELSSGDRNAIQENFLRYIHSFPYFVEFMLVDAQGKVIASSSPPKVGTSLFTWFDDARDQFEQALHRSSGGVYISGLNEIPERFEVQDSGIGISPEAQGKLFQAFSQVDGSTTRKYGGTGLGLAICKRFVTLMEGQIGVQSEPGKGSTFWFTVQLDKQGGDAKSPETWRRDLSDLRVLAVDDNVTNRRILCHQLGAWQIQADGAASGQEALARLRATAEAGQPYDLALLDVQMPEMDGLTLAHAIKGDLPLADTRLIVLTSVGQAFSPAELEAAGIEAYLVKPVKQSCLFDCLANAMCKPVAEKAVLMHTTTAADRASCGMTAIVAPLQKLERMRRSGLLSGAEQSYADVRK
jgi:CheY-like chemotaxis protein